MEYWRSLMDLLVRAGKALVFVPVALGMLIIDIFERFIKDHLPLWAGPIVDVIASLALPALLLALLWATFLAYHELRMAKGSSGVMTVVHGNQYNAPVYNLNLPPETLVSGGQISMSAETAKVTNVEPTEKKGKKKKL